MQDIFVALATLGDEPDVLQAGCHCLCELIDRCPVLVTKIGEDNDDMPVQSIMAALVLHPENAQLCQSACEAIVCTSCKSVAIQEVCTAVGRMCI